MSNIGILGFLWLKGLSTKRLYYELPGPQRWSSSGCHENATREGLQDFTDFAFFGTSAYVDSGMTKSESDKKKGAKFWAWLS